MPGLASGFATSSNSQNKKKHSSASIHYLHACAEENMMSELHTLELHPQPLATGREKQSLLIS